MKIIKYYRDFKRLILFIKRCRNGNNSIGKFEILTTRNQIIVTDKANNEILKIDYE